jgi:divalent metal cation (Fe/Co/Zn/Cd) transporter
MKYSTKQSAMSLTSTRLPQDKELMVQNIMRTFSGQYLDFHKLKVHKAGNVWHINMHLVVSKDMTIRMSQNLRTQMKAEIEKQFHDSHIILHIEPCLSDCTGCVTECPSNTTN